MNDEYTNEEEENEETVEESDEKVKELEEKLKEKEEELEKERNKDKNFKNLKTVEQTKRKKLSEQVEELRQIIEQERENRQSLQDSIMRNAKNASLDQLAGEDKDLRQELEDAVKRSEAYLGVPKDDKELVTRYENAYEALKKERRSVNPIHAFTPVTGTQNALGGKEKRFTDTKEGNALFEEKFPQIAALEKKKK